MNREYPVMTLCVNGMGEAEALAEALVAQAQSKLYTLSKDGVILGQGFRSDIEEIRQLIDKAEELNKRVIEKNSGNI